MIPCNVYFVLSFLFEKFSFLLGYDPVYFLILVAGVLACGAVAAWQK